jgi:hypothetical protein
MSPAALDVKNFTIARYEYLVEDKISKYEPILKKALAQPDEYWEHLVAARN